MSAVGTTAHFSAVQTRRSLVLGLQRTQIGAAPAGVGARRQLVVRAATSSTEPHRQTLGSALKLPLLSLTAAAQLLTAGSASAIDFQQPLALTVELARVTEDHRTLQRPDEAIGDLGASPGPADIADVVNPANDGSPAQGLANKVIENIQPNSNSAQNLSDALGNPATDDAPKLQDALEQPAEMLKPGREVLVQRLQKDILPKIESQIAELAKQDEPNEATRAISKQLKTVQTDINRLVDDVQGGNADAIQADATGLQQQFDALRKAIPKLNAKNSDKATIAEKSNGASNGAGS